MSKIAGVTPATISNWRKTNKSLYTLVENAYYSNLDNDIDKKIEDLRKKATAGSYKLLVEIAQLEVQNETSPFIDDALFERREKLFNFRKAIYGSNS